MRYIDSLDIKKPIDNNLSYSSLKQFYKSPIDFIKYKNKKFEKSESMIIGSAVDCLLLTSDDFKNKYLVVQEYDRRTKIGKELHLKFNDQAKKENKDILKLDQYLLIKMMVDTLKQNNKADLLLSNTTETQHKIEFKYKDFNIRGFVDGVGELNGKPFLFDLKTTNDIDTHKYTNTIISMMYHLQASIYCKGFTHQTVKFPDFYQIVIENKEPFKCNVIKFDKELIECGNKIFKKLIEDFKYCQEINGWHMGSEFYQSNIEEITLPEWYKNSIEND